jgi:hypothetical protein
LSRKRVPKRIHNEIPNVKLVANLRDPVERAYSAYKFDVFNNNHSLKFEEAIVEKRNEYIGRGFYHRQIKRYLKYFNKEDILILIYDDLKSNPKQFLQKIYTFLGVDKDRSVDCAEIKENRGTVLADWTRLLLDTARVIMDKSKVLENAKKKALSSKQVNKVLDKYLFQEKSAKESIDTRVEKELRKKYKEDVENLSKLIGRDLITAWGYNGG